ncbi:MAG: TRAP transporter large permease subunit [Porticoccaceae bacterium]|jgi:tripartite ATP-independent transporter DctM subunit|nr:MAG: C4-dicarboxylate ABC transporter [SAR92 bacterium BACL16 MAG-120322-bin99]MDP4655324.1 TRAP transporter large permease subunit [Alphaproteobacteria bacterium]MDP4743981.1 TRAP transporter large permease subunit [Porticoccaceae bacterium]MDP4889773.1 TRAP transporter large permease subunit [Porticoccaceae bacterium]
MAEIIPLLMFVVVCLVLMAGYPVALSLSGTALIFALAGYVTGYFDMAFLHALPNRLFGTIKNTTLIAVPLFVLMGVMLEKSRLSEDLLDSMADLFRGFRSGLGLSVVIVGALLAASTGIVGATVVTMGLMSLPTMLKRGYSASQATGIICATGTLGQIIPPSIALVLLGDILSTAYQQAQLSAGVYAPKIVSIGDLFVGAIIPGLILVVLYSFYVLLCVKPSGAIVAADDDIAQPLVGERLSRAMRNLLPPIFLIVAVLGSILSGAATPTEAAGVGAFGATLLAMFRGQLSIARLREVAQTTTEVTSMVFLILIGAAVFSLVFRGFGGEELVEQFFTTLPGGLVAATVLVMVVIFLLGFVLDFIEITFVVVPIVGPVLLAMGLDPVWLGVMIAINLQTSFLTPPFGFALFYLRGVAPPSVATEDIYRGVVPFIIIQLLLMLMLSLWPTLATWLPAEIYN